MSTRRMVLASSALTTGFIENALMPRLCAFSGETVSLCPVHRMIGISFLTLQDLLRKHCPCHAGHGLIGDHQVEPLGVSEEETPGFHARGDGRHLVPEAFKHHPGGRSEQLFVIDEKYPLVPAAEG